MTRAPAKDLRYDTAPTRRERILDLVRQAGYYSLAELSSRLNVSEMTIRRDVRKLENQGFVQVVHGGVTSVTELVTPVDFGVRTRQHLTAKQAIARAAIPMLEGAVIVGFDAGTTVLEVAKILPPGTRLTAVTHSLPTLGVLASNPAVDLMGLGGLLNRETQSFAGPLTLRELTEVRIQKLLLGATAVRDGAMWCTTGADAETKRLLIRAADEVILLADSSKFGYTALMKVADLTEADTVVTESSPDDAVRQMLTRSGTQLVVATSADLPAGKQLGPSLVPPDVG